MPGLISDPAEDNQRCYSAARAGMGELVPALTRVISTGSWRSWRHSTMGDMHYDRLIDYFTDWLHLDPHAIYTLLERSEFPAAAEEIRRMLAEDLEPVAPHGAIGNGRSRGDNTNSTKRGTGADYLLARLKRDRPDLAQQVVDGTLSAHAAAIAAGIRRKMLQVPADDYDAAIAKIRKHYGID